MSSIRVAAGRSGAALAVGVLALLPLSAPSASAFTVESAGPVVRSGPQAELDRVMALQPGGVQVSDNAVVWGDGDVVLVVPDEGEINAPVGLGDNVRHQLLDTPGLRSLDPSTAAPTARTATVEDEQMQAMTRHGCPGGWTTKDYYCFYQYRSWGGRRVQFTGDTRSARASEWGFNNGTTSWVSNDVDCEVKTYNTFEGRLLWRQPENSVSSYVGREHNNKMSWWTCG